MSSKWQLAGIGVGLTLAAATLAAQTRSDADRNGKAIRVTAGYDYTRANAGPGHCGCFSLSGGEAQVDVPAWKGLSVVAEFAGSHTGSTSVAGQALTLLSGAAGPRFTYRSPRPRRYAPFAEALVGLVHGSGGSFPTQSSPTSTSATSLTALFGGGLDVTVTRHLALRAFEIDYGLTRLPNNVNNQQNLLRVSAGVTYRR